MRRSNYLLKTRYLTDNKILLKLFKPLFKLKFFDDKLILENVSCLPKGILRYPCEFICFRKGIGEEKLTDLLRIGFDYQNVGFAKKKIKQHVWYFLVNAISRFIDRVYLRREFLTYHIMDHCPICNINYNFDRVYRVLTIFTVY